MKTTSEQRRAYAGPAIFSIGFRPFFFGAGLWAAVSMLIWVLYFAANMDIPSQMSGVDWHLHEFVFGYGSAVIAGFLLTAVPNWTGRLPVVGWPLVAIAGLWLAGRLALLFSVYLPPFLAELIDLAFIPALALLIGREIVAGKNWRNLKVLIILALIGAANALFHYEAIFSAGFDGYGVRAGVALIVFLIMLVGGRIIPSFTRNWLVRQTPGRLPIPFNGFDKITMVASALALAMWAVQPEVLATRPILALAGALNLIRLGRWAGHRTFKEPLLAILHIGYAFVPLGFFTIALGDFLHGWARASQIPHAWTAGAIGVVTLAMLTRTSLGHSGRPLAATKPITAIYLAIITSVLLRLGSELYPATTALLHASATAWIIGFAGFILYYVPIFFKPRPAR